MAARAMNKLKVATVVVMCFFMISPLVSESARAILPAGFSFQRTIIRRFR
jgi:hypothetical protein